MKARVMKRAHQIARMLEGDYAARMSLALRQAWAESRAPKYVTVELREPNRKQKTWVAKIVGTHPVYKFERKFINSIAWGETTWELAAGVYEICENGKRYFIRVANGDYHRIEANEVA
ncbi:hypothetical protein [Brevibacillus composti]|uniref:Uncharacterized protein n=1 Tax=Brevibacillus composti TaxID=2796470 RepID=A0A7T5JPG5_9BACL|nr:hypothetical protein [Brevibacillus composti]QQE75239.1 hypothetical protein JD108_04725 [Brevibacillus composti]